MQPWIFGHGGVDSIPVQTGMAFAAISTDYVVFDMTPHKYSHDFDDMMTLDHIPIDFTAYITMSPVPGKTPRLLQNAGKGWYEQQVDPEFTSSVRDLASSHNMYDLCSNRQVLQAISDSVQHHIERYLRSKNLDARVHDVMIGAVTPPSEVLEETRRTAAQEQNKLTQAARESAETARKGAEIEKAKADEAYRVTMGMTMGEYLGLRALEIEKEKVELVREKTNVSIILGDGLTPTVQVK